MHREWNVDEFGSERMTLCSSKLFADDTTLSESDDWLQEVTDLLNCLYKKKLENYYKKQ